jgi:hypothetical protein
MSAPSDIRKLLGDREPKAYAALSCSIDGPIGETHLVVADGQLFVFTRESLLGEYQQLKLDSAHPPKLERGDFSDTLHLALADGSAHDLNVSSFERDAVNEVLAQESAPAAAADEKADDNPFELPSQIAAEKEAEEAFQLPSVAAIETQKEPPGGGLIELKKFAEQVEEVPPVNKEWEPNEETIDREGKADERAVYHSEHPGNLGCWLQFFLFAGAIAALWSLQIAAYESTARLLDWDVDTDSASYVLSKIVAVIAGAWLGVKLAGIISWIAHRNNWGGYLEFKGMDAVFHGPKDAWKKSIDLSKSFKAECMWRCNVTNAKPNDKKNFNVIVVFRQDGTEVGLGGIIYGKQVNFNVKGMDYTELKEAPKFPFAFTLNQKNLRKVIARIMEP